MQAATEESTQRDTGKGRERSRGEAQGASLKLGYILTQVPQDLG